MNVFAPAELWSVSRFYAFRLMNAIGALLIAWLVAAGVAACAATPEEEDLRKQLEDAVNFTEGRNDICPVHKIKMPAKNVPIQFGLEATFFPEFRKLKEAKFPFSDEFISGGCIVIDDPLFPKTGKVYVCPQCIAAWNRWLDVAKKKAAESKPK